MKEWWRHHQTKIPVFQHQHEKDKVEDLTGCIPLLLRSLLAYGGHGFSEVERFLAWSGSRQDTERHSSICPKEGAGTLYS